MISVRSCWINDGGSRSLAHEGGISLDEVQVGFDVAGLTPVVGIFADGINAVISVFRGDLTGAGLNVIAMVPILGQGATAAKIVQTGGQTLSKRAAKALNITAGTNLPRREVGKALEALKKDLGLPNRLTGSKILSNGELLDDAGRVLGNIIDYFP